MKMELQVVLWGGGGWGMDWIDVAQDRDRWRTLVNAVMKLNNCPTRCDCIQFITCL